MDLIRKHYLITLAAISLLIIAIAYVYVYQISYFLIGIVLFIEGIRQYSKPTANRNIIAYIFLGLSVLLFLLLSQQYVFGCKQNNLMTAFKIPRVELDKFKTNILNLLN